MNKEILSFNDDVLHAIHEEKPIVALESTIIAHGMPYPENIELAIKLENLVRKNGGIPATICIMNGKIKIGLSQDEMEILANSNNVKKVSRRDFGKVLANGDVGATTVAATMIAANMAGIKVFATGGIGGVHRGAEKTFDISADLIELSRTPVIVVSAGAKAILDLEKTLEFLETYGVPVYGYKTNYFPAFFSSKTNIEIESVNSTDEIVKIFNFNQAVGFNSGMLIANPIPTQYEIPFDETMKLIDLAVQHAEEKGIKGKKLTPFLLSELVKLSDKKTLEANIKLVENNVLLATEISKKLANI